MNINLKHRIVITAMTVVTAAMAFGATHQPKSLEQWEAGSVKLSREGVNLFSVAFTLDLDHLKVPSEEALLFTPVLYNDADSLELPSLGIYGRNRYYHYERRGTGMISGADEISYKNAEKPAAVPYGQLVAFEPWMSSARLKVRCESYGCCFTPLGERTQEIGRFLEPNFPIKPKYLYQPGDAEIEGELSGAARVQFVVDRWELHQDKFGNGPELAKILQSIDTIKNDKDLIVTEIWLKGFASPEASWQHNTMLAKNRTQAVRNYVMQRYDFDPAIIVTDYQPEDWAGLRNWVKESNMTNRDAILAIIDEPVSNPDVDWDAKEMKLRTKFPADRRFLLTTVYPPLRHTEYKIKYKVRRFLDKNEILRVMKSDPTRLTLNDFNVAANGFEPGSAEFNEVYDIMVRVYPDNQIANLNAANAALQSGNLADAQRFLEKAGDTPEAQYSRGLYRLLCEDYKGALPYVTEGANSGIDGAQELLKHLQEYVDWLQ